MASHLENIYHAGRTRFLVFLGLIFDCRIRVIKLANFSDPGLTPTSLRVALKHVRLQQQRLEEREAIQSVNVLVCSILTITLASHSLTFILALTFNLFAPYPSFPPHRCLHSYPFHYPKFHAHTFSSHRNYFQPYRKDLIELIHKLYALFFCFF